MNGSLPACSSPVKCLLNLTRAGLPFHPKYSLTYLHFFLENKGKAIYELPLIILLSFFSNNEIFCSNFYGLFV